MNSKFMEKTAGENARGEMDGSGPYKDSYIRLVQYLGRRRAAKLPCPYATAQEEEEKEKKKKPSDGMEEKTASWLGRALGLENRESAENDTIAKLEKKHKAVNEAVARWNKKPKDPGTFMWDKPVQDRLDMAVASARMRKLTGDNSRADLDDAIIATKGRILLHEDIPEYADVKRRHADIIARRQNDYGFFKSDADRMREEGRMAAYKSRDQLMAELFSPEAEAREKEILGPRYKSLNQIHAELDAKRASPKKQTENEGIRRAEDRRAAENAAIQRTRPEPAAAPGVKTPGAVYRLGQPRQSGRNVLIDAGTYNNPAIYPKLARAKNINIYKVKT